MNSSLTESVAPPSWGLLLSEPIRAAMEFAGYHVMDESTLPRGDGHAVVIFPGLATNEQMTRPLQSLCERLGYQCFDWGLGLNVGPRGDVDEWMNELANRIGRLAQEQTRPLSLVGWSLGGIYAREVAKLIPTRVKQVVSIGSPIAGTAELTNVGWLYRLLNNSLPPDDTGFLASLSCPPPVPTTSIYSRTDGIVAWQACVQQHQSRVENIEVDGSHCGMPWNPSVLRILADRLAQPVVSWKPYERERRRESHQLNVSPA